ncbi:hypothetical protein JW948_17055 [bacterium]|nr:hypothetical protein [bacterium]
MEISKYFCPNCRNEIDVMQGKSGIMNNCPHCGALLDGLKEARINELTNYLITLVFLTVFFTIGTIFCPPIFFVPIITGIWAYTINKKRKAAMGEPSRGTNTTVPLVPPIPTKTNVPKLPTKIKRFIFWIQAIISFVLLIAAFGAYFFPDTDTEKLTISGFIFSIIFFGFLLFISIRIICKKR